MIYVHRRFSLSFRHRILIVGEDLLKSTYTWKPFNSDTSVGSSVILVERSILDWMNALRRRGAVGVEPAWRFNIPLDQNNQYNLSFASEDGIPCVQNFGFDFERKSDAMMFKLMFHNHKGSDNSDDWIQFMARRGNR